MKNALLTSTPEGAKLKADLLSEAVYRGHILIEYRRSIFTDEREPRPFHEIAHYFNTSMNELGMIAFPDSPAESILTFDPPRLWGQAALDKSQIVSNGWNKQFDKVA